MNTQAYAVIVAGGKQHRVKVGKRYQLEKLVGEPGQSVEFNQVLLVGDGDKIQVGAPYLPEGTVQAKIIAHGRGEKITIIKLRRRKGYRRKQGHRQHFTEVEVTHIPAA